MYLQLAEPPYLLVDENADKVNKPNERSTEEEDDRNNDTYCVVCVKASDKSVNSPNNVEHRNAKNELYDKRKLIKGLDNVFHYMPPKKFILAFAIS